MRTVSQRQVDGQEGPGFLGSLLVALLSLSLTLASAEVALRVVGKTDADGNFRVRGRWLPPHRLPVERTRSFLRRYQEQDGFLRAHDRLGWAPRPGAHSAHGLYAYDANGIRIDPDRRESFPMEAPPGRLRIALFGDSFAHGSDVPFEQSWGRQLELRLREACLDAEVLNFGVDGYGFDQAYLRWRGHGRSFAPDVVVLGLQMENTKRSVNLIRPFYRRRTRVPFSKPRFVLDRRGGLSLVNVPALPPERVPEVLSTPAQWDLISHEHFFDPEAPAPWWLGSRVIGLLALALERPRPEERDEFFYDPAGEPARIVLGIVERFRTEAEASGALFMAVHLPRQEDLERISRIGSPTYEALLATIAERVPVVRPEAALLREGGDDWREELFVGHYSGAGSAIVAEETAGAVLHEIGVGPRRRPCGEEPLQAGVL